MSADDAPIVRVDRVRHRYGNAIALDGASLSIQIGTTVAFIGPDGVGKSTLLGLIAGVRRIQSGTVTVLGGDMASRRHRDAVSPRIAYTARPRPQPLSNALRR